MGSRPGDPAYEEFLEISEELRTEYAKDDRWVNSPFKWIKTQPSSRIGSIAEQLVASWLQSQGLSVEASGGSDSDRLVEGEPVEIKSSTLWAKGFFKFQQIRDQNYRVLICVGLSPEELHAWAFPKDLLMKLWDEGEIGPQHAGQAGSDTAWLQITPNPVEPEWVQEWGGSLPETYEVLLELLD